MKVENQQLKKYSPKSLQGALALFFKTHFEALASDIVLPHIVSALMELIDEYFPKTENMKPGEAFILGVDKDEKPGCRKSLYDTKMGSCVVEVVSDNDVKNKNEGMKAKKIKKEKVERIIIQAYNQDVVLSYQDVGNLLSLSSGTIGKYIKEIESEKDIILPTRAVIHDLGPKITHKVWIITKHMLEHKTIKETMAATHHSEQAINRYIKDFKRVLILYKKRFINNFNEKEISQSTGLSLRLVKEYINIAEKLVEVKR